MDTNEFDEFDEFGELFNPDWSYGLDDTIPEQESTRADKAVAMRKKRDGWIEASHTTRQYIEEEGSILTQMKVSLVTMMFSFADFCGIEEVYSTQYAQNFWQNTTDKIEMRRRKRQKETDIFSFGRMTTGGGER